MVKSWRFRSKIDVVKGLNFAKTVPVADGRYAEIIYYRELVKRKWEEILKKIESGKEGDLYSAIIKLDSLIDEILIKHGHPGNDMGERLRSIHPSEIKNYNDLWEAHKIRNRIVHETDFHISPSEAKRVINIYHKSLEDLISKELELI